MYGYSLVHVRSRSSKPILSYGIDIIYGYGCLAGTCHCPLLFFLGTSQALFKDSTESFGPCALKVNTVLVRRFFFAVYSSPRNSCTRCTLYHHI